MCGAKNFYISLAGSIAGLILIGITFSPARPAEKATLTVNSLADTSDGACNQTNCNLREAITNANGTPSGDTIQFSLSGTISSNSASTSGGGGGLYAEYLTAIRNSIIANSTSGENCDTFSSHPQNMGNNIDSGTNCGWDANNGSRCSLNPLLGPLHDNGGWTKTMALLTGSPAIDKVVYNLSYPKEPIDDQRGYLRPFGTYSDIGAFENYYKVFMPLITKN